MKTKERYSHLKLLVTLLAVSLCCGVGNAFADKLEQMISPISNPVNFEDPRANTEIRAIYLYHEIDNDFVTMGGNAQIAALQLRYAVNEKFAIIATKDGYVDFNPDAVLTDESGWANLGAGVKYAFYQEAEKGEIATVGLRYEAATGNTDVFQGRGDGFINPFVSAAVAFDEFNFMTGTGLRLAVDDSDSSLWDLDFHIDKKIGNFYPTLELNLVQVIDAGDRIGIADEGLDFFNFGASASGGKTVVTGGAGARYRLCNDIDLGVIYQFPLTSGAGSNLIDWRITTDVIFSF